MGMIIFFLYAFRMLAMLSCPTALGFNDYTIVMQLLSLLLPLFLEFIFIHNDLVDCFLGTLLACPVPESFAMKAEHYAVVRGVYGG